MLYRYSHWMPLIRRCPAYPIIIDFGYVTVTSEEFIELFKMRRIIHSHFWQRLFVEDIVTMIHKELSAEMTKTPQIKYRGLFGRIEFSI